MISQCTVEDYTPIVKNTFIDFPSTTSAVLRRCSSAPASFFAQPKEESSDFDEDKPLFSDTSTYAQTDATCSECGATDSDNYSSDGSPYAGAPTIGCCEVMNAPFLPQRLNSRANAFQPKALTEAYSASAFQPKELPEESLDPASQHYKHRFAEVVNLAKKAIQDSVDVRSVQIDDTNGWTIIIQPQVVTDSASETDRLITLAKDALLEASSTSNCIYVMGYCGPKPFKMKPQGFEATLGAMENAKSACYHVFKKGFCRHGADCTKQHPACEQIVQVVVESASLRLSEIASCTRFATAFKQEFAALVMMVAATLQGCAYADEVEAFENKGCAGWTIEVTPKEEMKLHKDFLLSLAKNALFSATSNSNTVYIMGYAAQPFLLKSQGFLAIVGDMKDDTKACWDLYSKGFCTRDCTCRWEHPECLMPINVVVKERSSLKCSAAMLDYVAGNGTVLAPHR